jgi:hypothetical protein
MKNISAVLLLAVLPVGLMANPKNVIFRKTVEKDFNVNDRIQLHIGNKYGKISLHTWNKNEVKATIVISGYGKSEDEAEKFAGLVNIDASQSPGQGDVSIVTSYNKPSEGFSSFWHLLFSGGNNGGKGYVNIDYEVYAPASLRMLQVEDNYGDVIADAIPTPCDMAINYCDYDLNDITGPLQLKMNYSKGSISKAGTILLSANYSTLENEDASSINTHSSYSNYRLATIGTFSLNSSYDDIAIDNLGDISGESDYTHYRVGTLTGSADLHLSYGNFKVDRLSADFHRISIHSSYGGASFRMDPKTQFRIDAHLSYGSLNTGDLIFKDVNSSSRSHNTSFSGHTEGAADTAPLITFEGDYSDFVLKTP